VVEVGARVVVSLSNADEESEIVTISSDEHDDIVEVEASSTTRARIQEWEQERRVVRLDRQVASTASSPFVEESGSGYSTDNTVTGDTGGGWRAYAGMAEMLGFDERVVSRRERQVEEADNLARTSYRD